MKVKVCGMKDERNVKELVLLHPDYIGFIFYPLSSRFVGTNFNPKISSSIPESIKKTGVFVNEKEDTVLKLSEKYNLDYVQLHGEESPEYCKKLAVKGLKIIKAFGITNDFIFSELNTYNEHCTYFLFDTKTKEYGGSGKKFNWEVLQEYSGNIPFFLSGGIDLTDVEKIKNSKLKKLHAVDINSRFEKDPGIKNIEKVKEFIKRIK